jgi:hypothetical protein
MKKLITILVITLGVMSCKKDEPTPPSNPTCACTKTKQQLGAWGAWNTISTTTPFSDFCDKDGLIEYEGTMTRYLWSCQ